jgi:hypothetical protein
VPLLFDVSTRRGAVHEMTHALGFSKSLYPTFIDDAAIDYSQPLDNNFRPPTLSQVTTEVEVMRPDNGECERARARFVRSVIAMF